MIEIAFDKNLNNTFKDKEYPLLTPPLLKGKDFEQYIHYASSVFQTLQKDKYIIVFEQKKLFEINKLAFAFFVVSCFNSDSNLECLVIKTKDEKEAFNNYKPYVALSIAVKYAIRICQENTQTIYKELETLTYLNFSVHKNFSNKTLIYKTKTDQPLKKIETNSLLESIARVSWLKFLSLNEIEENIELIVNISDKEEKIAQKEITKKILEFSRPYILI